VNCGKYKAGAGDTARTHGEADQDHGKVQEHPNCAIIIAHSVKKDTDIYCLVSERTSRKKSQYGKLTASFGQETEADDAKIAHLTVSDRRNGTRYLIDTGADISVLLKTAIRDKCTISKYKLYAANNTLITTYGTKLVQVDLGLRRKLDWTFVVADVKQAIIGADFLAHYGLVVDLTHRSLRD